VQEVFADRAYARDGTLVPRRLSGAVIRDADQLADRVVRMVRERKVRSIEGVDVDLAPGTICVHGDDPDAVTLARAIRARLAAEGIEVRPFSA
jgi:UPF0271 protein